MKTGCMACLLPRGTKLAAIAVMADGAVWFLPSITLARDSVDLRSNPSDKYSALAAVINLDASDLATSRLAPRVILSGSFIASLP